MDKKYFADKIWSEKLKDEFPNTGRWWVNHNGKIYLCDHKPDCLEAKYLKIIAPAIHTDMITQILPRRIDNEHQDLSIVFDSINDTVWIGYDGKELKDEIAASDKKLVNAACKLFLWLKEGK